MNCSIPGLPVHYQWTPRACSNSYPLSWWCHPIISSSVVPFSSCHQSFPASGSFLMSWLFASCGQGIGASASASALPMSIHGWFPLESTCLIFLQSKGLSRVFSNNLKASMEGWVCKCQNKDSEDTIKFHIPVSLAWGLFRDRDLRGHDRSSSEAWAPAAEAGMLLAAPPRPLGSHQAECRQTKENVLGCSYSPANRNRAQTQDSKVNTRQV